jgi:hypothetical protein
MASIHSRAKSITLVPSYDMLAETLVRIIIEIMRIKFLLAFIVLLITSCSEDNEKPYSKYISFGQAQKVDIIDYDDHIMEPFLSKNGMILFFNNLNHHL